MDFILTMSKYISSKMIWIYFKDRNFCVQKVLGEKKTGPNTTTLSNFFPLIGIFIVIQIFSRTGEGREERKKIRNFWFRMLKNINFRGKFKKSLKSRHFPLIFLTALMENLANLKQGTGPGNKVAVTANKFLVYFLIFFFPGEAFYRMQN